MTVLKTLRVTFTCDGCGKQEVVASPNDFPRGWSCLMLTSQVPEGLVRHG